MPGPQERGRLTRDAASWIDQRIANSGNEIVHRLCEVGITIHGQNKVTACCLEVSTARAPGVHIFRNLRLISDRISIPRSHNWIATRIVHQHWRGPSEYILRLNSWCRHVGWMVRPVSVRQPSIRLLWYWMLRRPWRMVSMRCSGVVKATLDSHPRRSRDQIPSTGLRSGA